MKGAELLAVAEKHPLRFSEVVIYVRLLEFIPPVSMCSVLVSVLK